ncbi:MAG: ABC transporter ATP-binding protein [Imperialibacter sp.]|uniref:ABC transporter ATP-binding protein n=1 Tax=Imperialibacter sp. TaxID=2038411 RepID=UPI0032EDC719
MTTAIKVENLSKAYQLGQFSTGTISKDLHRWWMLSRGKEDPFLKIGETNDRSKKGHGNFVWSLKDINFEIQRGDAVGIIGKNGAGKSTLLKILSQVTSPTTGKVKVKGRIASLLEVGTGFHPELTGKENIFLNGAILGMRKAEIQNKFDEIVDFSGVERYIDTPVKRYSSGMYVRLAFAVAAHLESEILIVDEVLAVGDAEFQEKCLGKMDSMSKSDGRTILFVSHNLSMIRELCSKGILLENGLVKSTGEISTVVDKYVEKRKSQKVFNPICINEIDATITKVLLNEGEEIVPDDSFKIDLEIVANRSVDKIGIELMITHEDTTGILFATNTKTRKNLDVKLKPGINRISCVIRKLGLSSGTYALGLGVDIPLVLFYYYEKEVISFEIKEVVIKPSLLPTLPSYGHFYMEHDWLIEN